MQRSLPNGYAGLMGDREEIRKRLANFRDHQERLNREPEDPISKVNQTVLKMLEKMRKRFPDLKH